MCVVHGQKTDIKFYYQYALERNIIILTELIKDMNSKIQCRCFICNYEWQTSFNKIYYRNHGCKQCADKRHIGYHMSEEAKNKIRRGHSARLKKDNCFVGKDQREIARRLRDDLTGILRNPKKHMKILSILGCSIEEYRLHLESKFVDGMTWENRGFRGWHIDHIKPLALFDLTKEEERKKACHYTNLQPMWATANLKKHTKYKENNCGKE